MTTASYLNQITSGILTLVSEEPTGEETLTSTQYYTLMFYAEYFSYLRSYLQYKNSYNYNEDFDTYDIDVWKKGIENDYYVSKHYDKIKDDRGRVLLVTVTDITKCTLID